MASVETKKENVLGLDTAPDRAEAEYNLVESLLTAASFKESADNVSSVDIKRSGVYLFTVHIHPISDKDTAFAKKKATKMGPHPNNRKMQIAKEVLDYKLTSWLIYLATTEEDQKKIWGNPEIMSKFNLMEPWEAVDVLLTVGEKNKLAGIIAEISGMDDDDDESMDDIEFAKN